MRSARLLLVALTLGCGVDNLGPSDFVGVYTLLSVSGEVLPHTGWLGDVTLTVTGGTLTLERDGTGRLLTQYADQPEPSAADIQWVWHHSSLDLSFHAEGVTDHPSCFWEDGTLIVTPEGNLLPSGNYLYQRGAGAVVGG